MKTQKVSLEQVLDARERRAEIQNKMLSSGAGDCLVCLTLNIAGDIKRTPMTGMLFCRGVREFNTLGLIVIDSEVIDEATGTEAFWLLGSDMDADQIKHSLESIEEAFPAARLFDFDVLVRDDVGIRKLSRSESRKCLICDCPAAECARSRSHGLDAIRMATDALLKEFCADTLAEAAYESLLDELYTTPKPGLVDLESCGAHTDMDVPLFEKSAKSLKPYLHDAALLGMNGCSMKELRARGLAAEKEMFRATGGVNTHKGMIYSMGLLLAGMGMSLTATDEVTQDMAVRFAAELARQDAEKKIAESLAEPVTNGGRALKTYGARGAVGEAAAGFPDAVYCASRIRFYSENRVAWRRAGTLAFCDSMAKLEDTNLLHRGGKEGLDFARKEASRISGIRDYEKRIAELSVLDKEMIKRNLSPGGSADILALAYILERWRLLVKTDNRTF